MLHIFIPEGGQGGQHRQRRGLAQTAKSHGLDHLCQFFQGIQVFQLTLTVYDPLQNLQHPLGTLPAGSALAAGFPLGEAHEEPGHFHYTGILAHDHHAAGTHNGIELLHGVEVQRLVQVLFRQAAAGGAANLNCLEFRTVLQAAADIEDDLPQGGAHRHLDQAGVLNGTGEGEGLAAGAAGSTDGAEPVSALQDDLGDIGVGFHVVQNRGFFPQALFHGSGGLGSGHAPIALDGSRQRRAFAADEGAGAPVDVHMEIEVGAQNVVTQQAGLFQLADGAPQTGNGHGIFGTDIDIAVLRLDGVAGDHHAFDELEGIAFHHGAVHKRAGVTFVTVADHIAVGFLLAGHLLPLLAGGEAAAATAAEAGFVDLVNDLVPGHLGHGLFQRLKAACGHVFIQGFRIELAAVFQNDSGLLGNEWDLVGRYISLVALFVKEPFQCLVTQDALFKNLCAVVGLHLDVLGHLIALLDPNQGAQLAEALAAGFLNANQLFVLGFIVGSELQFHIGGFLHQGLENFVNLVGTGGNTAGTGADQDTAVITIQVRKSSLAHLNQLFNVLNHQPLPLNSAINASAFSGVMEG